MVKEERIKKGNYKGRKGREEKSVRNKRRKNGKTKEKGSSVYLLSSRELKILDYRH